MQGRRGEGSCFQAPIPDSRNVDLIARPLSTHSNTPTLPTSRLESISSLDKHAPKLCQLSSKSFHFEKLPASSVSVCLVLLALRLRCLEQLGCTGELLAQFDCTAVFEEGHQEEEGEKDQEEERRHPASSVITITAHLPRATSRSLTALSLSASASCNSEVRFPQSPRTSRSCPRTLSNSALSVSFCSWS